MTGADDTGRSVLVGAYLGREARALEERAGLLCVSRVALHPRLATRSKSVGEGSSDAADEVKAVRARVERSGRLEVGDA